MCIHSNSTLHHRSIGDSACSLIYQVDTERTENLGGGGWPGRDQPARSSGLVHVRSTVLYSVSEHPESKEAVRRAFLIGGPRTSGTHARRGNNEVRSFPTDWLLATRPGGIIVISQGWVWKSRSRVSRLQAKGKVRSLLLQQGERACWKEDTCSLLLLRTLVYCVLDARL